MGMTLGLNTALSGLLTNQKGLDVISQNIVNVNTKGYVRKVMSPESVTLAGAGAGVQQGGLTRWVDEGLMKDIRAQSSTQGALDAAQTYYPRIEDLFGQVRDETSISHRLQTLQTTFETLTTSPNTAALQWQTVSATLTVTNQFQQMTDQLQSLRLEADRGIESTVGQINEQLATIFDLNQKIVRGTAIGTDVGDLEDKRDTALTSLAKYMDIQYFQRGDGSVGVFTPTGKTLVDKQAAVLTHAATTVTDSWMTKASGNFSAITIDGHPDQDVTSQIGNGQLKALIDMRDTVIPNLQAQVDEAARQLKLTMNQVHNRGTSYPTARTEYTGTRQLVDPANSQAALSGASPQRIWLSGNDDTTIALFDSGGNQVASTTLRTIMSSTAYASSTAAAGAAAASLDITQTPGVSMEDVAAKIQSWMRQQTYQGNALSTATASVATGTFTLNTGSSAVSLAFRDQVSSTAGSAATDTRINFDVDGDGEADQQVGGFSNFFGLNDLFTLSEPNSVSDSEILSLNYTTTQTRTIRLLDPSGQIGNTISVPAGSSLATIAQLINTQTQTSQSAELSSSAIALSTAAQITIGDTAGTIAGFPITIPTTATSLKDIADAINAVGGTVQAKLVEGGPGKYQLRVWDSRGKELDISVANGTMTSGKSLSDYLSFNKSPLIQADVVPEGSGERLRIRQTNNQELFVAADQDGATPPGSLITDLGLHVAATRTAGLLGVRTDIQGSPSLMARGTMQYNADIGQYYMSEGDNTTSMALAAAMSAKTRMATSGQIYAGSYTFAEHVAATIGVVSTDAAASADRQAYQTTLGQALDKQYTSYSGVNLDEEVANMISFQQAYSASAKVISTLQDMLETLVNIVR